MIEVGVLSVHVSFWVHWANWDCTRNLHSVDHTHSSYLTRCEITLFTPSGEEREGKRYFWTSVHNCERSKQTCLLAQREEYSFSAVCFVLFLCMLDFAIRHGSFELGS